MLTTLSSLIDGKYIEDWLSSYSMLLTRMYGKTKPTTNVANQLTMVATVTATGLVSCRKSSGTIVHGMAPE